MLQTQVSDLTKAVEKMGKENVAELKAVKGEILAKDDANTGQILAQGAAILAIHEGKCDKQLQVAEKRQQQSEALVARVDAGGGTRLEELKLQEKRTKAQIAQVQQQMKNNKSEGLRCASCGSLEGEMVPYIGKRFLCPCCADLHVTEEELLRTLETCCTEQYLSATDADAILQKC